MGKDKKYYTPKIEEFHVGFEFEYKQRIRDGIFANIENRHRYVNTFTKAIFHKSVYLNKKPSLMELLEENYDSPRYIDDVIQYIQDGAIRVKHLDENDIIDLGWGKHEISGLTVYKKEFLFKRCEDHIGIMIINFDYNNLGGQWVLMSNGSESSNLGDFQTMFAGFIKNKSELKRVMKQVGIL